MSMPKYMKVRQYLYNLMKDADGSNLQIQPESELCRLFGVSHVTVRGAINGMVKDKYLIPKRGLGTFINPAMIGKGAKRFPLVGLLWGDGKGAMNSFDPIIAKLVACSGMRFETLYLPESGQPERFLEVVKSGVDALIWSSPDESVAKHLEILHANSIPALSIDTERETPFESGDCIYSDKKLRGKKVAEALFEKKHRNAFFIHNYIESRHANMLGEGSAYASLASRFDELWGDATHRMEPLSLLDFEKLLRSKGAAGRGFTAVYSLVELAPYIASAAQEAGLAIPKDFSCILNAEAPAYFFKGLRPDHVDNATELQEAVVEWLDLRVMKGKDGSPFARRLDERIVHCETVIDNIANA